MKYAIVVAGVVQSLVDAPTPPVVVGKTVVAVKGACQVGWIYMPGDALRPFQPGNMPARAERLTVADVASTLSSGKFVLRFTQAERTAIRQAATQNAQLDDFMYVLEHFPVVDRRDAVLIAGLSALTAVGLLGPGRQAEILGW